MNIEQLTELADKLADALDTYAEKPTKAESKRIRMMLGQIKAATPALRAELVEADKKGY